MRHYILELYYIIQIDFLITNLVTETRIESAGNWQAMEVCFEAI